MPSANNSLLWIPPSFPPPALPLGRLLTACVPNFSLAWLEMRLLLCKILWHFDLEMCSESKNWIDQKSYLVWEKGPLMVRLAPARVECAEGGRRDG
jgi:hypothetical protein